MLPYIPSAGQQQMLRDCLFGSNRQLWAEMGCGKSAAVLDAFIHLLYGCEASSMLIVAPRRAIDGTWPDELAKWAIFKDLKVLSLADDIDNWHRPAHIYLINYDRLPRLWPRIAAGHCPADTILFDELTRCKNPASKRMAPFHEGLRDRFARIWGMTGTPMPNDPMELFGQALTIDGGDSLGDSITRFQHQFFYRTPWQRFTWFLRDGAMDDISSRMAPFTTIVPGDPTLPFLNTIDEEFDMPPDAMTAYKYFHRELVLQWQNDELAVPNAAVLAGKLLQMTGGAVFGEEDANGKKPVKVIHNAKIELLRRTLKKGNAVVFYWFTHEYQRLKKAFPKALFLADDPGDKQGYVKRWNTGAETALFCQTASAAQSLNLQGGGNTVIWFSNPYSGDHYEQGCSRVRRRGQKSKFVNTHRLVARNTVDEAVIETLQQRDAGQRNLRRLMTNLTRIKV